MSDMSDKEAATKWEPKDSLKNAVYVIERVGLVAVVVLFLLGQSAGWVPSMAHSDHLSLSSVIGAMGERVVDNSKRIASAELASLRTQQIALQICVNQYSKEDQYKCLKPYER